MNLQDLLSYVQNHNMNAWIENGEIYANAVYTKDGQVFTRVEKVGSTLLEVRNWLGY